MRDDPGVDLESADERTIRLLNEEVALLRRRAATFCGELRDALAGDIEVLCEGSDEVTLDSRRAVSLALITSERVTNALKHAFPEGRTGTVWVSCGRYGPERAILTVHDDGIGIGDGAGEQTIGLKLMQTLVKGIGGTLTVESAKGTRVEVTFPL